MGNNLYPDIERLADEIAEAGHKAVMLCGICGSGKTTLAEALARRGFATLSIDRLIYDEYGAEFQQLPSECQRQITCDTEQRLAEQMAALTAEGKAVVADGCFCKRVKRDSLRRYMLEHGIPVHTVYLQAPLEETWRRICDRAGSGWNDIKITRRQLEGFFNGFERPDADEL